MVQNISNPGVTPFVGPAKPANTSQPPFAAGLEAGSAPSPAPGGSRPVDAATAPDGDKRQADERARERPLPTLSGTHLSIALDEKAKVYVYRGVNGSEVKGQWPSEDALRRIAALREMSGKILDETT